jgi:hypothetical protein
MRCWESLGDLPLVIEIVVSFRSFSCAPLAKRHAIFILRLYVLSAHTLLIIILRLYVLSAHTLLIIILRLTRGRSPGLSQECMLEPISLQIIISSVCADRT